MLLHLSKRWLTALALCLPLACWAVDVNQATEAELDGIKGLGPASTARILKARETGPFKSWADLMARVKGIKPATAGKLSTNGLTVNQQPFSVQADSTKAP